MRNNEKTRENRVTFLWRLPDEIGEAGIELG